MVVEDIRYRVPADRHDDFERAWCSAPAQLKEAPECLTYEVSHGVAERDTYVVRIEWNSLEDHEHGFRQSPRFERFLTAVKSFFGQIEETRHYRRTPIASAA